MHNTNFPYLLDRVKGRQEPLGGLLLLKNLCNNNFYMNFEELIKKVRDLNILPGEFAIFGSGPMAVRGLKEANDLDVIVTKKVYDDFKKRRDWVEKSFNGGEKYYLEQDKIELWNDWGPGEWNIPQLIKTAEIIDALPYVNLKTVLQWKERNKRPKDLIDIEKIKTYLGKVQK